MSVKQKYQLVLLGARASTFRPKFVRRLNKRLDEIGSGIRRLMKIIDAAHVDERVSISPTVAVYFGDDPTVDLAQLNDLVANAVPVLPVVSDLENFTASVPAAMHPINGMQLDPVNPDFGPLINLVLENLALLRRTRRLFLSYRRHESTPVAQQLRTAFDNIGYDAFLDTSSVPKGDEFQSVLWHRLLDSDVMVVLDTADFLGSQYTREEIAKASAMSVGMLQVLWPGVGRSPYSLLATPLQLTLADFDGEHLTSAAEARLISEVETLRARCLAARHTNLVGEFSAEATRVGATVTIQPQRYALAEIAGRRIAAIPAVGVPDAQRYHEASRHFPAGGVGADEAVLIYDHRGMLPEWMTFLDWLDDFLPVKGLRVTDTAMRLEAL